MLKNHQLKGPSPINDTTIGDKNQLAKLPSQAKKGGSKNKSDLNGKIPYKASNERLTPTTIENRFKILCQIMSSINSTNQKANIVDKLDSYEPATKK